jgi:hypothetical protein
MCNPTSDLIRLTLKRILSVCPNLPSLEWVSFSNKCKISGQDPPDNCQAAGADELTDALSPLEESLEFLDLELYEQHRCVHYTHEALDLSSFTKLRLLGIAPELLTADRGTLVT